ncbi:4a-hydroxytetrahydrobiopterin dehydratase [Hyphobacterium sp. CCMP332]|nr:4a-hydroxytetrahydrobiopterin dehydratase [Hyphobacterium sp. CCMP332]
MWKENKKSLSRSFEFANYVEAFGFVNKVAMLASKQQHFPKICIEKTKVDISLSTDKIGGFVTQKDHELAEEIDEVYGRKEILRKSA